MMLLVSGATKTVYNYSQHPNLGVLVVPDAGNKIDKIPLGMFVAADNGCFDGLKAPKFVNMLEHLRGKNVAWATCPDAVGNAKETDRLYYIWSPVIREFGLSVSYVLQDGITIADIPWKEITAVFIGGTTEWKLGNEVREIVKYAKSIGKWVHMGRVNSFERLDYARQIGCDSVDGTKYSMFPDTYIPRVLGFLENEQQWIEVN